MKRLRNVRQDYFDGGRLPLTLRTRRPCLVQFGRQSSPTSSGYGKSKTALGPHKAWRRPASTSTGMPVRCVVLDNLFRPPVSALLRRQKVAHGGASSRASHHGRDHVGNR